MKRFLIVLLCLLIVCVSALADTVYVLCQPDSFVYVRAFPVKGSEQAGYAELGDALETDGVKKNGFLHVGGFEGDAWINIGFVTEYPGPSLMVKRRSTAKAGWRVADQSTGHGGSG